MLKELKLQKITVVLMLIFLTSSCTEKKVETIQYGRDYCDHCKMQITDKRYGGAILTIQGRTLKFDSIECLAEAQKDHKHDIKEIYLVDYDTSALVSQKKIGLYKDEKTHGPMGTHIQGHIKGSNLSKVRWDEVGR